MDEELKEYLVKLETKLHNNNERGTVYLKQGRKLIKLFSENKHKVTMSKIKEHRKTNGNSDTKYIVISYGFYHNKFLHGPMVMTIELLYLDDKLRIMSNKSSSSAVHYTVNELKNRGFKTGDYKRLYNKVNNGVFNSGMKVVYYASDLDK